MKNVHAETTCSHTYQLLTLVCVSIFQPLVCLFLHVFQILSLSLSFLSLSPSLPLCLSISLICLCQNHLIGCFSACFL